jgi:hypothetical protein
LWLLSETLEHFSSLGFPEGLDAATSVYQLLIYLSFE